MTDTIQREREESALESALRHRQSALLCGPHYIGKWTVLRRVVERISRETGSRWLVARADLGDPARGQTPELTPERLIEQMLRPVVPAWPAQGAERLRDDRAIEALLARVESPLVLALSGLEASQTPGAEGFLDRFQAWIDRSHEAASGPWSNVRCVAMTAIPLDLLSEDYNYDLTARLKRIDVGDLDPRAVRALAELHGLRWDDDALERLRGRAVGGHPYLLELVFREATRAGCDVEAMIAQCPSPEGPLRDFLKELQGAILRRPGMQRAARWLVQNDWDLLDPSQRMFFAAWGLIGRQGREYTFRYPALHRALERLV